MPPPKALCKNRQRLLVPVDCGHPTFVELFDRRHTAEGDTVPSHTTHDTHTHAYTHAYVYTQTHTEMQTQTHATHIRTHTWRMTGGGCTV